METVTVEQLTRETGRGYRTIRRHLALANVEPVGRVGQRVLFQADLARAAMLARIAAPCNAEDASEFNRHRALREKYAALTARTEYETLIDSLIARDDVDACLRFIETTMRSLLGVFPEQNAPALCAETDIHEIHAMLTEACRAVLDDIGLAIERQKKPSPRASGYMVAT